MNALAQFPLMRDEMSFLNEIYEDLGSLAREGETTPVRLQDFGTLLAGRPFLPDLIPRLYQRVRREAEAPPAQSWRDERVGVPEDQQVPPGLDALRLLANYSGQCLVAIFGLYRGFVKVPEAERIFERGSFALHRLGSISLAIRRPNTHPKALGGPWHGFNLSGLNLSGMYFAGADLSGCSLRAPNKTGTRVIL
jgi:hypothetical protein